MSNLGSYDGKPEGGCCGTADTSSSQGGLHVGEALPLHRQPSEASSSLSPAQHTSISNHSAGGGVHRTINASADPSAANGRARDGSDGRLEMALGDGTRVPMPVAGHHHHHGGGVASTSRHTEKGASGGRSTSGQRASEPLSLATRLRSAVAESRLKAERERAQGRLPLPLVVDHHHDGTVTAAQIHWQARRRAPTGEAPLPAAGTAGTTSSKRERDAVECNDVSDHDGRMVCEVPVGVGTWREGMVVMLTKQQLEEQEIDRRRSQGGVGSIDEPQVQRGGGDGSSSSSSSSERVAALGNCSSSSSSNSGSDTCGHVGCSATGISSQPSLLPPDEQTPRPMAGEARSKTVGQHKQQQPLGTRSTAGPTAAAAAATTAAAAATTTTANSSRGGPSPSSPSDVISRIVAGHRTRIGSSSQAEQSAPKPRKERAVVVVNRGGGQQQSVLVSRNLHSMTAGGNQYSMHVGGNQHSASVPVGGYQHSMPVGGNQQSQSGPVGGYHACPLPAPLANAMAKSMLSQEEAEGIAQMLAEFSGGKPLPDGDFNLKLGSDLPVVGSMQTEWATGMAAEMAADITMCCEPEGKAAVQHRMQPQPLPAVVASAERGSAALTGAASGQMGGQAETQGGRVRKGGSMPWQEEQLQQRKEEEVEEESTGGGEGIGRLGGRDTTQIVLNGYGELQQASSHSFHYDAQSLAESFPDLVWPADERSRIQVSVSVPFTAFNPPTLLTGAAPPTASVAAASARPQKVPRSIRLSPEVLSSMGMAERPLDMREVRSLTVALAEAVEAGSMPYINVLQQQLQAASCPVGPAPQRMAHMFATCLASRVAGDGFQQYLAMTPPDSRAFEAAYMHYTSATPFAFFFGCCAAVSALQALGHAHSSTPRTAVGLARPTEHLHIIDVNIETAYMWLPVLRKLAGRPQGPPTSLQITLLDAVPSALAEFSQGRRVRAMQLKEQLAVQAVVVGIEEFECDVVFCGMEELQEGLGRVQLSNRRVQRVARAAAKAAEAQMTAGNGQSVRTSAVFGKGQLGVGSAAKRFRPAVSGNARTQDAVSAGEAGPPGGVDVLVVSSIVKLQDYSDEAVAVGKASPRQVFLQWAHSLQPDLFLNITFNIEGSGPFLVPRVKECFDFQAAYRQFHDSMFSQHSSDPTPSFVPLLGDDRAAESHDEREGKKPTFGAFRMGLPESRLKAALNEDSIAAMNFRRPLNQQRTLAFERFVLQRSNLNSIALEGPSRFIRPWSHGHWLTEFRMNGLTPTPIVPLISSQVCFMMQGLPDSINVASTTDGLAVAVYGRDNIHASFFSTGHKTSMVAFR